jgi:hypothetical protein
VDGVGVNFMGGVVCVCVVGVGLCLFGWASCAAVPRVLVQLNNGPAGAVVRRRDIISSALAHIPGRLCVDYFWLFGFVKNG